MFDTVYRLPKEVCELAWLYRFGAFNVKLVLTMLMCPMRFDSDLEWGQGEVGNRWRKSDFPNARHQIMIIRRLLIL